MSIEKQNLPEEANVDEERGQISGVLEERPSKVFLDQVKSENPETLQKIEEAKNKIREAFDGLKIQDADWIVRVDYIDARGKHVPGHGWDHVHNPDKGALKLMIDNPVRKNQTIDTTLYGTDDRETIDIEGYQETNAEFPDDSEGGPAVIREYDVDVTEKLSMVGIMLEEGIQLQYDVAENKFKIAANTRGYWSVEMDNV